MKNILYTIVLFFICACNDNIPKDFIISEEIPEIYPDYNCCTIPYNIAPLNFQIKNKAEKYISISYSSNGDTIISSGQIVDWDIDEWHKLLLENKNDTIFTDIFLKKGNKWNKYSTLKNFISDKNIDNYITYRLIEPSYELFEKMSINQRNLTNFEEKVIYKNHYSNVDSEGQCINCHSTQNYNLTNKSQFHIRLYQGGTLIATPDKITKVNLKTGNLISSGVYPAWHPYLNIIAYSINETSQFFHQVSKEKVEVIDSRSDLVLYNIDKNEVSYIANDTCQMERFPSWSPDGKYLYYSSADYPEECITDKSKIMSNYKNIHYNILRKKFDTNQLRFEEKVDTIYKASDLGKSATLPRISPDGKYLLVTLGDYGNFHIWHKSSDLYLINLDTNEIYPLDNINSNDVESYHSWSSNGAWIIFSSRRDDGSYTRPYIASFNNGICGKPFIVPQKNPETYKNLFKSFNIPEFMINPFSYSLNKLKNAVDKDAINANFSN